MAKFLHTAVEKAIIRVLDDLGTPVSARVKLLYETGDWDGLASCKIDPGTYGLEEGDRYWRDATATSLLRKCVDLPTSVDRKAVAEGLFLQSERECLRTNARLYPYLCPEMDQVPGVRALIRRAQKLIAKVLGPLPDFIEGKFGPGSTFADTEQFTTVPDKMSSSPTSTVGATVFHHHWWDTAWGRSCAASSKVPLTIQGNRFSTVPKDSTKHRGIAIEPSINLFYQLGVGRHIRAGLKRFGINLKIGQEIHRQVACRASITRLLMTLDLSNASDTICRNLVKLLLPPAWFEVLDSLRSPKTLFKGNWHLLEKFSSMGNGFTFELETLIFLSLVMACDPQGSFLIPGKNVFVYGDDIICPVGFSKDVMSVLSFFGMTVNKAKTFVDGPFRESCGGDYFNGVWVRPHFIEESPNEPQQLIALANGIRRLAAEIPARWSVLRRSWFCVLDALPSSVRGCRGPTALGDLVIHDEESRWQYRQRQNGIRYIKVYKPVSGIPISWDNWRPNVTLASALYGLDSNRKVVNFEVPEVLVHDEWTGEVSLVGGHVTRVMTDGGVIPRDSVAGYKHGWVAYS